MKSLLILGAADGAMATYRTARALGYRTVAVDLRDTAPAVALADELLPVSTRDVSALTGILRGRSDVAGILAPSSDIALPTQLTLTERFGLPCGLTEQTVEASVDKRRFRAVCDELGLPGYRWIDGPNWRAAGLRFPLVVKPADAQSSRGVTRCPDESTVDAAIEAALEHSYGAGIVIEEEVRGQHCGCECVIDDGRVVFMALTERHLTPPPQATTTAHVLPAAVAGGVHDELVAAVDALCARLGYRRGPLNLDLVVDTGGRPRLIEMGARTGGDPLGELARHCYGIDPIEASISVAVGAPLPPMPPPAVPRPVMVQLLNATDTGILTAVHGVEEARARPEVVRVVLLTEPGRPVTSTIDLTSKLGYALLAADTPAQLRRAADRLLSTIRFEVRP
ncbi:ATP-grasp domain-containing protein [Dactylosporangium siamense]|uniref:Carbamoyl phosphate synthase n=1 Tax=Dactylosporangium siamense TaxID=685454 RepID=A0A919U8D5_9ACTN|nr:ATP-grasp domain-containing protein [Dactylosporangium siamense]GIG42026.1 carbamoyl phosphate synthase [Dactylosporangium siamense]